MEKKGEKVKTLISLLKKNKKPLNKKRGFSLVEILLVIVLLSLMATSVVPKITSVFRVSVQSSVRRFGALVKYAFDQSVLTQRIHRIVLDLENQRWYLEAAPRGATAGLEISERESDIKVDPNKILKQPAFEKVKGSLVDKMPPGVEIVSVDLSRKKTKKADQNEDSKVYYIFAYPSGYIESATVGLAESGKKGAEQTFRISIQSLTGKVKVNVEDGSSPR
jgi:prepilin-type N-terminal cleavage/methylation domain-containing protein